MLFMVRTWYYCYITASLTAGLAFQVVDDILHMTGSFKQQSLVCQVGRNIINALKLQSNRNPTALYLLSKIGTEFELEEYSTILYII